MSDTKPCERCEGDGLCPACQGEGFVECECFDCGDLHTRDCTECDGGGECGKCAGSGTVGATEQAVTELALEKLGQLVL